MEHKTWHTMTEEKQAWGTGSWQHEPDKEQFVDEETGYPCLIKRNHHGSLCGYVGVTPDHPWYGVGYSQCTFGCEEPWCLDHAPDGMVDVHGGLTYSEGCQEGPEDKTICHVPGEGEPDNLWWFGFDCGHAGDMSPGIRYALSNLDTPSMPALVRFDVYRDIEYVKKEIASLARQLKAMGDVKPNKLETRYAESE